MPKACFTFTPDFVVQAMRRHREQHGFRHFALAIKCLSVLLFAPFVLLFFSQQRYLGGLIMCALILLMFFAQRIGFWIERRSFLKSPFRDEEVTIEFSHAGFHARSAKLDSKLQWSAFTRVVQFQDGFLLFQGPKAFNWIPISSLESPAQVPELESLLRDNIREHKVVQPCTPPQAAPTDTSPTPSRGA